MTVNKSAIERIGRELLAAIGEDPEREGIVDTPKRFAKWWAEFIDYEPGTIERSFNIGNCDEIVAVTGIEVWSLCEHHLLPFSATVAVAYIPTECVLGLSKFGRIAHEAAHRLQVQERMTQQIADRVQDATQSPDIAVIIKGEHLCMTMRGIRTPSNMHTSVMRGRFKEDHRARAELFDLIKE